MMSPPVCVHVTWCLLCLLLVELSSAFVLTSSNAVLNFSRLDLAPNLKKFIEHEEIRLKVIRGQKKHKAEVPLVEQRIAEFKSLDKELQDNVTSEADLVTSYLGNHPTSVFVAVRNFVYNWDRKLKNVTLYGARFNEFINKEGLSLPDKQDLVRAATAVSVIQEVYNLTVHQLTSGRVMGHQGAPLSPADSLYIGKIILSDGLLERAAKWVKSAVDTVDLDNLNKATPTFNISDALATLARLTFQTDKDQHAALKLLEKASELDPENEALHRDYVRHRSGRGVMPLPGVGAAPRETWKQKYFDMCHNSTNITSYHIQNKTNPRLRCRYKASPAVPYVVYKEEILNVAPYVSVIYDFVTGSQAERIKNASVAKLTEYVLPGNSRATMWQYRGNIFYDESDHVFANVSRKCGDVTGLDVRQNQTSHEHFLGEPVHVIDYGIGGLSLPHADNKKKYTPSYMRIQDGNRYATLLVQLSDVTVGGATVFIEQNITIAPRKGNAVLVYHYLPAGDSEQDLYVGTCPLALGQNVVLEKGIWQTIYEPTNVCGKKPSSTHLMKELVQAGHRAAVRGDRLRALAGNKTDVKEGEKKSDDQAEEEKKSDDQAEEEKHEKEDEETKAQKEDDKTIHDEDKDVKAEEEKVADENEEKHREEEPQEKDNVRKDQENDKDTKEKEKEDDKEQTVLSNDGEEKSAKSAELPDKKVDPKGGKEENDSRDENKVKETKSTEAKEEQKGEPQVSPKGDVTEQ